MSDPHHQFRVPGRAILGEVRRAYQSYADTIAAHGARAVILRFTATDPTLTVWARRMRASEISANQKHAVFTALGATVDHLALPDTISEAEFQDRISAANADPTVAAVIVQTPVPLNLTDALGRITAAKDIDCLTANSPHLACATADGITRVVEPFLRAGSPTIAVVGARGFVGGGVTTLLRRDGHAPVELDDGDDLRQVRDVDIVISTTGRAGLLTAEHLHHRHRLVVDAGFVPHPDGPHGDVHPSAQHLPQAITPVPGGVGPIEMATLAERLTIAQAAPDLAHWRYHGPHQLGDAAITTAQRDVDHHRSPQHRSTTLRRPESQPWLPQADRAAGIVQPAEQTPAIRALPEPSASTESSVTDRGDRETKPDMQARWAQRPHGALPDARLVTDLQRLERHGARLATDLESARRHAGQLRGDVENGRGPAVAAVESDLAALRAAAAYARDAQQLHVQHSAATGRAADAAEQRGRAEHELEGLRRAALNRRAELSEQIDQLRAAEAAALAEATELAHREAELQLAHNHEQRAELRAHDAELAYPHAVAAAQLRDLDTAQAAEHNVHLLAERQRHHAGHISELQTEQGLREQMLPGDRLAEQAERAAASGAEVGAGPIEITPAEAATQQVEPISEPVMTESVEPRTTEIEP